MHKKGDAETQNAMLKPSLRRNKNGLRAGEKIAGRGKVSGVRARSVHYSTKARALARIDANERYEERLGEGG